MDLIELIVIYLACGAPFGVYQATSKQNARLESLMAFLLWPIFAARLLRVRLARRPSVIENRLDALRIEMEKAAFPNTDIQALFDFREVFDRFTGLAEHVNAAKQLPAIGSSDQDLQTRCLDRRNRNRIARHYMQAREEFVGLIAVLSTDNTALIALAVELTDHLGDPISPVEFRASAKPIRDLNLPGIERTPAAFEVVS